LARQLFETLTIGGDDLTGHRTAALAVSLVPGRARRCREEYVVNLLKSSRGTKFLAGGAVVAAIGLGTGGWAFAASSSHAPTLTPAHRPTVIKVVPGKPVELGPGKSVKLGPGKSVKLAPAKSVKLAPGKSVKLAPADDCSGLTLTPVSGAPAMPVLGTDDPTPVPGTPIVCGDEGTTG
jgi:hypothetical protein